MLLRATPLSEACPLSVTEPRMYAPGFVSVTVGPVLSTRRFWRTLEVAAFPARAVATVRGAERPAARAVVWSEAVKGGEVSVSIVVQLPAPAGERWNATDARPEPPVSLELLVRTTLPSKNRPGSSSVATGAAVSTFTTDGDV